MRTAAPGHSKPGVQNRGHKIALSMILEGGTHPVKCGQTGERYGQERHAGEIFGGGTGNV